MRQVAAGEIGGLETLYDRYHTMAYALALRITTETGLAEDVVQDSFLGVWRNAGRYAEAKGSVRGWLLAIVRHRAIDAMRRQRAGVALGDEAEETSGRPHPSRHLARSRRAARCRAGPRGPDRPAAGPARSHRAGLLRRLDPAGDRGSDSRAAGHGEEPHAARAGVAARAAGGRKTDGEGGSAAASSNGKRGLA